MQAQFQDTLVELRIGEQKCGYTGSVEHCKVCCLQAPNYFTCSKPVRVMVPTTPTVCLLFVKFVNTFFWFTPFVCYCNFKQSGELLSTASPPPPSAVLAWHLHNVERNVLKYCAQWHRWQVSVSHSGGHGLSLSHTSMRCYAVPSAKLKIMADVLSASLFAIGVLQARARQPRKSLAGKLLRRDPIHK